jgi:hypothetical protein
LTTRSILDGFREVWLVDSESPVSPSERATPACLVGREYHSGRVVRLGRDDLRRRRQPPYPIDDQSLLVAFDGSSVAGFHLAMGWAVPTRVLDLRVEFRNRTNGLRVPCGTGLLGALTWHGLDPLAGVQRPQSLAFTERDGSPAASSRDALFDACEKRVAALAGLLGRMLPEIELGLALLRGRYMAAVARMERSGVPM